MKRHLRLIVTAVVLLGTLTASARFDVAKRNAPKAYVGLRGGVGASSYANLDDPVAVGTPLGGVALGVKVSSLPLYLETGAYYMNMGTKFEDWYWDDDHYRDRRDRDRGRRRHRDDYDTYKVNNYSLMVPLVATYHFYASDHVILQPFGGLFYSYGFDNEQSDFGLREGLGAQFGHFYVGLGANVGLIDQDHVEEGIVIEDGLHVSLFLNLGLNF